MPKPTAMATSVMISAFKYESMCQLYSGKKKIKKTMVENNKYEKVNPNACPALSTDEIFGSNCIIISYQFCIYFPKTVVIGITHLATAKRLPAS
jgi:hypothetical protein